MTLLTYPHGALSDSTIEALMMANVSLQNSPLHKHLDGLDRAWAAMPNEETTAFANAVFNGMGPTSSNILEEMTFKDQQPMEVNWSNSPFTSNSMHGWAINANNTGSKQLQSQAQWPSDGKQVSPTEASVDSMNTSSQTPQKDRMTGPMPVLERIVTEPIWQRRLNAKNKELEQLRHPLSAMDGPHSAQPFFSGQAQRRDDNIIQQEAQWPHTSTTMGTADHDFTHASPDSLQTLGMEVTGRMMDDLASLNALSGSSSTASSVQGGSPQMNQIQSGSGLPGFEGSGNHEQADFAGQLSFLQQSFSASAANVNGMPQDCESLQKHSSSLPESRTLSGYPSDAVMRSPDLGNSFTHISDGRTQAATAHGEYAIGPHDGSYGQDVNSAYVHGHFMPSPPQQSSSNGGKGVINKVIVPSAPGAQSDTVDLRTGEAGQMRHMCPHPGCDKHFSTSGHARRHSRIHDCLRPFECPHEGCHATFTRRDNCTQHQRARHNYQLVAHRIGDAELK